MASRGQNVSAELRMATVAHLDVSSFVEREGLKDSVMSLLSKDDADLRKQAVMACSKLLVQR